MVLFSFFLALSTQGPRKPVTMKVMHHTSLPGSVMDLTALLNNKKFRGHGNKEGATRVFLLLQQDKLGRLEARRGRNSKVSISMHFTSQNQLALMLLQVVTAILVASSTLTFWISWQTPFASTSSYSSVIQSTRLLIQL